MYIYNYIYDYISESAAVSHTFQPHTACGDDVWVDKVGRGGAWGVRRAHANDLYSRQLDVMSPPRLRALDIRLGELHQAAKLWTRPPRCTLLNM